MEEKSAVATETNRLYWETEQSVAEIANQLGVSRRALYEVIEPMPAGLKCNRCKADLYFANRSAKAAGVARCLSCGDEREIGGGAAREEAPSVPPYSTGWPKVSRRVPSVSQRTAAITGFAIAGVVVGAVATLLIRRKT